MKTIELRRRKRSESAQSSLKINNVGEKSHLYDNRFEIEKSFQLSSEFKFN